jgi:hypothetical protein
MKKILLACALFMLIVNYGIGQSNHTVTFSGSSGDFSADEKYSASAGSTDYYITFDATYLYIGAFRTSGSFGGSDNLAIYIDTDPNSDPTSGTGTTTGQSYNSVSGTLPFSANYNVHAEQSYQEARSFGSSWGSTISGLNYWTSTTAREVKIPFSSIGSPKALYLTMWMGYNSGFFSNVPGANIGASGNPTIVSYFGGIGVTSAGCYPKNITDDPITGSLIDAAPATGAKYGYLGSTTGSNTAAGDFSVASGGSIVVSGGALDISGRIVTMASGTTINNTATFTTTGSTLTFNGIGTVSGTVGLKDVNIAGGVNFGTGSTINGTLTINAGGYVNTSAPNYADGSILVYNAGTPYDRSAEWAAGSSGVGVPYNVKVNTGFSLNMDRGSGTGDARTVRGKLTLAGSMSFKGSSNSGQGTIGGLTVNGDLLMEGGTLTLGHYINPNGSDLVLFGNWDRTSGSFVGNGRAVFLDGTTNTAITTNTATVINYLYVRKTAPASVTLNNELQVANVATVNDGATLNCGTNYITGAGTFTVSSGATLGIGSVDGITSSGATGNIRVSGTRTFSTGANYNYNGTSAQVSGGGLPATVNNFTIDNATGVKLSNTALTVSGTMTINSGKLFTLESGKQLTVSGTLTKSAVANELVINSGASLITNSAVSATVEREIAARIPSYQGWHFISSPIASQAFQSNFVSSPPSSNEDFYLWSETTNEWVNSKSGSSPNFTFNSAAFGSNFIVGQGYLAAYSELSIKSFSGTLNVVDVPKSLTYTGTSGRKGWNLLGNPFTSGIKWNVTTWGVSNVAGVAKIIKSSDGSYQDISADGYIPALNGFLVRTTVNNQSITIPATAKEHNGSWYKSDEIKQFALTVRDIEGATAQTSNIRINPEATSDFDFLYDGEFVALYAPQFYSIAGENKLSTNSLPEVTNETVINFGFVKNDGSQFKIEAEDLEEFGAIAYLTDLKTGMVQNLNSNPVYSFTSVSGDQPNRFKLSFESVGIEDVAKVAPGIYTYGNKLCIENSGQATLEVYNMAGQRILVQDINNAGFYQTTLNNQTGYYIVRLTNAGQVKVSKVFIK